MGGSFGYEDTSRKVVTLAGEELKELPQPNPNDFIGLADDQGNIIYTVGSVAEDNAEVERLKEIYAANGVGNSALKQTKDFSAAFEALIMINAELCNWFGPDAMTIRVSEFDDIKNGVDFVIRFSDEVLIAVDVTASDRSLDKKFDRIKQEIDNGGLANLKYFYDENTGERGMLENIPRVIIAADGKTINQLGELWLESKKDKYEKKSKLSSLEGHFIQMQILEEIRSQLEFLMEYASDQEVIVNKYKDVLQKIEEIIDDKPAELRETRGFGKDRMFAAIQRKVGSLEVAA